MKLIFSLMLLGFVSQVNSAHADPKYWLYQRMLQRQASLHTESLGETPTKKPLVTNGTYNQVIDHFASATRKKASVKTFKQRYFVDATYAKSKSSPVIYYFCGEGACEGASSTEFVNSIAQEYGAYRVALEHRYYGTSQPFPTLANKNLVYLSMDQAIEDLASFQKYISSNMGLTGKWISMGGSYAGELSAFYRLKHPELVIGALASSAPVLSKADFFEYDRHIARVAPAACVAEVQKVVAAVEAKLHQSDSAAAVRKLFDASAVKNDVDFLYVLADMAATAVQYGYQEKFCKTLTEGAAAGKAIESYAQAGLDVFRKFGITSLQDSFQGAESLNPKDYMGFYGARAWMYQSCTEFGYYQIANSDRKESARSSQITLPYHDDVCKRLFGLTASVDTAKTNKTFYDQLFDSKVKNIFFTNGANDPWSNLSLTTVSADANRNQQLKLYTIAGAAHCDDLGGRDSPSLKEARDEFDKLMKEWLSE